MDRDLKIVFLILESKIPNWSIWLIEEILNKTNAQVELLSISLGTSSPVSNTGTSASNWILNFHLWLEQKSNPIRNHPYSIFDNSTKICKNISLDGTLVNNTISLDKENVAMLIEKHIDVIFNLTNLKLSNKLLEIPTSGVWKINHASFNYTHNCPKAYWEIVHSFEETGAVLILQNKAGNHTIYEWFKNTDDSSINRNLMELVIGFNKIIVGQLQQLKIEGTEHFLKKKEAIKFQNSQSLKTLYQAPSLLEAFNGLTSIFMRGLKRQLKRKLFFDQWIILYNFNSHDISEKEFSNYTPILPPKDRFWADPFPWYKNNKHYIFFEELVYSENKGKIAVMEISKNGEHNKPITIIETDYHLSYPHLFEINNDLYMIPESMEHNTIDLYKCLKFPDQWEKEKTLIPNIKALDTTIFKHENKFFMFTTIIEHNGVYRGHELFLFWTDDLLKGTWQVHQSSPIKINQFGNRPAGNLFNRNNSLYRPAQNSTKHYGYGMIIQEISELSPTSYKEKEDFQIHPNWDKKTTGIHTYNQNNNLSVIDAIIKRKK